MTEQDWRDLASVYRTGANYAGSFNFNANMLHQAGLLNRQALRCQEIADERKAASIQAAEAADEAWKDGSA